MVSWLSSGWWVHHISGHLWVYILFLTRYLFLRGPVLLLSSRLSTFILVAGAWALGAPAYLWILTKRLTHDYNFSSLTGKPSFFISFSLFMALLGLQATISLARGFLAHCHLGFFYDLLHIIYFCIIKQLISISFTFCNISNIGKLVYWKCN